MGWFLRLNVGLYTAGNPTFFTRNLPWDSTAKITWAETHYLSNIIVLQTLSKQYDVIPENFTKKFRNICESPKIIRTKINPLNLQSGTLC